MWTALVPWGDAARRMNLLSALLAALSVGAFYLFARQLRLSPAARFWRRSPWQFHRPSGRRQYVPSAHALNSLLVIVLLRRRLPSPLVQRTYRLCISHAAAHRVGSVPSVLCAGFGAGAPSYVAAVDSRPARAGRAWPAAACRRASLGQPGVDAGRGYLAALAAPMLLYAYIPLRAPATPYPQLPVGGGPELGRTTTPLRRLSLT